MTSYPTKIDLTGPADSLTPSDLPSRSGTPNSTTTTMSELSTVAIKDGHRGHLPHHGHGHAPTSGLHNQLDVERADRISRLAGFERVTTTARNPTPIGNLTPGAAAPPPATTSYFDASGNPVLGRERSTVGSASATGSAEARTTYGGSEAGNTNWPGSEAGRTTWPGSEAGEQDKMSETQDMDQMDTSSVGGMSDEGTASLVAFGEGARTPARHSIVGSSSGGGGGNKAATPTPYSRDTNMLIDSLTHDRNVSDVHSTERRGLRSGAHREEAERIVRENMNTTSNDRMMHGGGGGQADLGKFGFEK